MNAFNHASTAFGDVVWAGQSTRHVKQALADAGLTQERLRALWSAVSPVSYYDEIMRPEAGGRRQEEFCWCMRNTTSRFRKSIRCRW